MKYGYFDDKEREYVIDHPDTPSPWVNYLGSPEYGAIISNNAGGFSFCRTGGKGRNPRYILKLFVQSGGHIYIRATLSGGLWVPSWPPGGKKIW